MKRSLALLAGLALVFSTSTGFAEELPESPRMGLAQPSVRVAARNRPLPKKRTSWIDNSLFGGLIATHAADWASTEQCLRTSQEQEKAGFVGLCHEGLLPTALVESKVGLGAYEATTAGLEVYSQYVLTKAPSRAHCPHRPTRQYSGHCVCGGTQLPYDPRGSIPVEENLLCGFSRFKRWPYYWRNSRLAITKASTITLHVRVC